MFVSIWRIFTTHGRLGPWNIRGVAVCFDGLRKLSLRLQPSYSWWFLRWHRTYRATRDCFAHKLLHVPTSIFTAVEIAPLVFVAAVSQTEICWCPTAFCQFGAVAMPMRVNARASKRTSTLCLLLLVFMPALCFLGKIIRNIMPCSQDPIPSKFPTRKDYRTVTTVTVPSFDISNFSKSFPTSSKGRGESLFGNTFMFVPSRGRDAAFGIVEVEPRISNDLDFLANLTMAYGLKQNFSNLADKIKADAIPKDFLSAVVDEFVSCADRVWEGHSCTFKLSGSSLFGTDIKTASGDPSDQSDLDICFDASRKITPQEWSRFAEEVNESKYFYEDPDGLEGSKAIRLRDNVYHRRWEIVPVVGHFTYDMSAGVRNQGCKWMKSGANSSTVIQAWTCSRFVK